MTFTTITEGKTNLPDGTYRLSKAKVVSPATVTDGQVSFLVKGVTLEGKTQYKKL